MKSKPNKIIIGLFLIVIIASAGIVYFITYQTINFDRTKVDYIATIYHTESDGIDAGTEYVYYIYPHEKNTFIYYKTKADITIAGIQNKKDITSVRIKSKEDFLNIEKDIKKDQKKGTTESITYTYIERNNKKELNSLEELANELFK